VLQSILKKLPADTLPFVRFCLIGGVNTVIHALVLFGVVRGIGALACARPLSPVFLDETVAVLNAHWVLLGVLSVNLKLWANVVAFLVANGFSYFANSRWSFGAELRVSRYARFLPTSVVGLICAYSIMSFVLANNWPYILAVLIQVCITPFINFPLLRLLVFPKQKTDGKADAKADGKPDAGE
jgi:putative flippase GtrA